MMITIDDSSNMTISRLGRAVVGRELERMQITDAKNTPPLDKED